MVQWPDPVTWAAALESSTLVADPAEAAEAPLRPLVWDGRRLYLHRLWTDEVQVATDLRGRAGHGGGADDGVLPAGVDAALQLVFGTDPVEDRQHQAGRRALEGRLAVIVGGPGTGKTRTVARLLAAALVVEPELQLALCAPTGKAAARMTEAVQSAVEQLAQEAELAASEPGRRGAGR